MRKITFLYTLIILLMAKTAISQEDTLDRTKPPKAKPPKDVAFPDYIDTTLPNGINLLVIENSKIPAVSVRLVFKNAGSYYDSDKNGAASITAELLVKGTKNRTAVQIAEEIDFYGANLATGCDWDGSYVTLSVLKKYLNNVTGVLADVVMNPVFSEDELDRVKEQRIAAIQQSKDEPDALSGKMFDKVVFENSPYAYPPEGTEKSVKNITRKDIVDFYEGHYCTSNLILAFVGDVTPEEVSGIVNNIFGTWQKKCSKEPVTENTSNGKNKVHKPNTVYIVDKPDAVQSNLRVGNIGIARNNPDFIAVTVMNTILGGFFGSRINLNLREKHGYTYGARSSFSARIFPGDFSIDTDVRNEVTDSSVTLIIEELERITTEEVTEEELQTVKNYLTGIFPIQLETANAVAARVINLKLYGLPKDYYNTYISSIQKLTKQDILNSAKKYIHPDELYIVLSGNSNSIKERMRKFGDVQVFDADDNPVK
jgi:zinc protease